MSGGPDDDFGPVYQPVLQRLIECEQCLLLQDVAMPMQHYPALVAG